MGHTTASTIIRHRWVASFLCFLFGLCIVHLCTSLHDQDEFGISRTSRGCTQHHSNVSSFVSFIIPSKGRASVDRTLHSLVTQTDTRWRAVVVFDGEPEHPTSTMSYYLSDPRVRNYTIPKTGEHNFAGILRSYGMSKVKCSDWFAFVDDDDVLSPEYVARLLEESRLNPLAETVIFRMSGLYSDEIRILPPQDDFMFKQNFVGISFAIKRQLFEAGFWFQPSAAEDFTLLKKIFDAKRKMVISPYITYYVKDMRPVKPTVDYPRCYLN